MIPKSSTKKLGLSSGSSVKFVPGAAEPERKKKKKKKREAEDDAIPVKKKKRVTEDGEKPHKGSVSKAKRKAERLGRDLPTVEELEAEIPTGISNQEREHLDEYLHMYRSTSLLIRKSETHCLQEDTKPDSRDLYALCALYSQQREIIADIRSVSDMSGQVATMESTVIRPMISSIGQNILDCMFQVRKVILDSCRPDQVQNATYALELITKEQGKFMQGQYSLANEKVSNILLG